MCGSSPLPEAVAKSMGTGAVLVESRALSAATRPLTASWRAGFDGPRLEPLEDAALSGTGDVAESRLQKYFGSSTYWPSRLDPTGFPSFRMRLPPACRGKRAPATSVTATG